MMKSSSGGSLSGGHGKDTQKLVGKVENISSSHTVGEQRVTVRKKTGMRETVAVDMPVKEIRNIERKETYSFEVTEKHLQKMDGQNRPRFSRNQLQTYHCDTTPEVFSGSVSDDRWNRFGGGGSKGRNKF